MFTVKHIDTDGTERIYSAETVEVVRNNGITDGIYLDWPPVCDDLSNEETYAQIPRPGPRQVIRFALARSNYDTEPKVFVMNREGSTVATYRL